MIVLDMLTWWEISQEIFDDSAGPLDQPPFSWQRHGNSIELHFEDPREETMWRLRWLNTLSSHREASP